MSAEDNNLKDSKIGLIGIPVFLLLVLTAFFNLLQL